MNWAISDFAGNSLSCQVVVTVTDDQAPEITCPSDITVTAGAEMCDALVTVPTPITTDNCTVAEVWNDYNGTDNASGTFPLGDTEVIWFVEDQSGNISECTMTVTVETPYAPIINCISDTMVFSAPGICGIDMVLAPTEASLECSIVEISNDYNGTDNASGYYEVGVTNVTWTVTDISGNVSTCTHVVTVIDDELPTIDCPDDISLSNDPGECGAIVTYSTPVVWDNCEVQSLVLAEGYPSGSYFPVGVTTMTFIVTDASNNQDSCSFEVNVIDDEAPLIECPLDIVSLDSLVSFDYPFFSDNCYAEIILTTPIDSGQVFPHGYSDVCFAVSDLYGNADSCCFNILVNKPPVAINDTTVLFESDEVITVDVLDNDYDLDGDSIFIESYTTGLGTVFFDENGLMIYDIPNNFCGIDSMMYIISDVFGATDTAWVFVEIECSPVIFVPEGFSPNADGVNDVLRILGLRQFPENKISIFNRWGHKVYSSAPYRNDWDGKSQSFMTLGATILPRGTYYYVLDLGDDKSKPIKGFIYINPR